MTAQLELLASDIVVKSYLLAIQKYKQYHDIPPTYTSEGLATVPTADADDYQDTKTCQYNRACEAPQYATTVFDARPHPEKATQGLDISCYRTGTAKAADPSVPTRVATPKVHCQTDKPTVSSAGTGGSESAGTIPVTTHLPASGACRVGLRSGQVPGCASASASALQAKGSSAKSHHAGPRLQRCVVPALVGTASHPAAPTVAAVKEPRASAASARIPECVIPRPGLRCSTAETAMPELQEQRQRQVAGHRSGLRLPPPPPPPPPPPLPRALIEAAEAHVLGGHGYCPGMFGPHPSMWCGTGAQSQAWPYPSYEGQHRFYGQQGAMGWGDQAYVGRWR